MHDIYIAFISLTLRFADTCTHSVPIFVSAKQIYCCRLRAVSVTVTVTVTVSVTFSL